MKLTPGPPIFNVEKNQKLKDRMFPIELFQNNYLIYSKRRARQRKVSIDKTTDDDDDDDVSDEDEDDVSKKRQKVSTSRDQKANPTSTTVVSAPKQCKIIKPDSKYNGKYSVCRLIGSWIIESAAYCNQILLIPCIPK